MLLVPYPCMSLSFCVAQLSPLLIFLALHPPTDNSSERRTASTCMLAAAWLGPTASGNFRCLPYRRPPPSSALSRNATPLSADALINGARDRTSLIEQVMSIVHSIRASAARHAALVQGINALEATQHALERCAAQIADLRKQITRSTAALMRAVRTTEAHRVAHVGRRGTWRGRFAKSQTMQAER
jgi:hypothetical protein